MSGPISAALKHMFAAGMTPEQIMAAVADMEAAKPTKPEKSAAALRQERYRLRNKIKAEIVTETVTRDATETVTDETLVTEDASRMCAQVVIPTSSLRSEDSPFTEPTVPFPPAEFSLEPEKPKPKKRGTRLREDWEPSELERGMALAEGLNPQETNNAAREFRNFWLARSRDNTRLNWTLVWQNRVAVLGQSKRERLAREAKFTSGGGRSIGGLGEHLMRVRSADRD